MTSENPRSIFFLSLSILKLINIDDKWIKNVHRKTFKLVYWYWRRYNKWPTVLLINVSFPFFKLKAKKAKTSFYSFLREMCCLKMFFHVSSIGFSLSSTSKGMLKWFIYRTCGKDSSWYGTTEVFSILLLKESEKWHLKFLKTHFFFHLQIPATKFYAWSCVSFLNEICHKSWDYLERSQVIIPLERKWQKTYKFKNSISRSFALT